MRLSGLYISFGELSLETNRELHAKARALLNNLLPGITDIVPSYSNLYIEYDGKLLSSANVQSWLDATPASKEKLKDTITELPTRFDGEDLAFVAQQTGLNKEELIERFTRDTYHVYALGFTPGFPFMGELDEVLRLPRRQTPRSKVPPNSVAIANAQVGVYPLESPGGWHLLGRSLQNIYDPNRAEPLLLEPGDSVRFTPSDEQSEPLATSHELLPKTPERPFARVLEPGLQDLVVDKGRFMAGRFGFARGGPLDAKLANLANKLLGNPENAPLLELTLTGARLELLRSSVLCLTGWALAPYLNGVALNPFAAFAVKRGDVLSFEPTSQDCRAYLAVAGGIDAQTFMDSASVDVRSKLGRTLETDDILGLANDYKPAFKRSFVPHVCKTERAILRLIKGPQANPDALAALCDNTFTVGRADRMGVALEGADIPGGEVLSEAVPLGAVQITSGGTPVILLNDRGTLGGYTKPALVHPGDLHKVAQLRPGARLRFVVV